jgi:predicted nucleic acid-binding protein
MKYMIDTNIFDRIADQKLKAEDLPEGDFVSTVIQLEEINNISDDYKERRFHLIYHFSKQVKDIVPTESAVWGLSRWDEAKAGDGVIFNKIKQELDSKNNSKKNNVQDSLIAETAIKNGFTLVTADKDLGGVAEDNGCMVIFVS